MTQPIDVAYVEIVGDTKVFKRTVSKEINQELKKIEKEAQSSSDNISKAFKQAGEEISGVFRDKGGHLRDATGKFVKAGEAAAGVLTEGLTSAGKASQTASAGFASLFSSLGSISSTGPVGIAGIIVLLGALAVAATVAAAAIQSLGIIAGAALAALPGLIGAAIAGFGILAAALHGVGAAFTEQSKKAKSAGSAGAKSGRQIADAQRGVLQAQKDVIKAREDELDRIEDIRIALIRARVTEARATDDVKNAQLELQDARALNSPRAITEAQLRLDEANATLLEAKDHTKDLAKENAKAAKNGVNGSEQVLRAQEALRDATDRLAQAQMGVGAAAAASNEEYNKLSKSAQGFVMALIRAKEQLKPLQLAIQEAFFKGSAPLIQPIVDNLKDLEPELTGVASAFGDIFKEVLKFLGSPEGKAAFQSLLTGLQKFLVAITPAIGPLLEAFAGLAGASGEFGDSLGGKVADALIKFADWVKGLDLKQIFKDAREEINKWLPIIKSVFNITITLLNVFARIGNILLPLIEDQLNTIDGVLKIFQNTFNVVLNGINSFFSNFKKNATDNINIVKTAISSIPSTIINLGKKMVNAGKVFLNSFFEGFGLAGAGNFIANFAKSFANSIIRLMNRFVLGPLNEGIAFLQSGINRIPLFGGVTLPRIPSIPQLETGGIITQDGLFRGGEKGKKEGVIPLEDPRAMRMVGGAIADAGGTGGGGSDEITVNVYVGNEKLASSQVKVVKRVNRKTARAVKQRPRMV